MLARNSARLAELEHAIPDSTGFVCDVGDLDALTTCVAKVRDTLGDPAIVIHNALRSTRGGILEMDPEDLERNFRVNATALLYLARETLPHMLSVGSGALLVTGNTSATRGKSQWGFFASTKAAQRILAESMAREFGPQGIHVAYFVIDASIDTPRTRPTLAPNKPDEFFAKPTAIADEMYHVAHQDRSTWSFLVELRPFGEVW
jgi:NAD(P)-dependent dehydrogenase (short-subunit alcohol dehydrogenase family)